jgi:hypothetical protein
VGFPSGLELQSALNMQALLQRKEARTGAKKDVHVPDKFSCYMHAN